MQALKDQGLRPYVKTITPRPFTKSWMPALVIKDTNINGLRML